MESWNFGLADRERERDKLVLSILGWVEINDQ